MSADASEWKPGNTLPVKDEDEKFSVYLALDDGSVMYADWISYTSYGSEFHASTGVYLGSYPQDGDAYYMTANGDEIRQDDENGAWFYEVYADEKPRRKVIAWMEAMKPLPLPPSRDRDRGGDNAPADLDAVLKEGE